ncbi:MAG: glycosyl hydrolase family 28 protein [Rikenellaceae bacterium]
MKRLLTTLFALFLFVTHALSAEIYVESFGAVADGVTLNTKSIQAAIDDCTANGGGTVVLKSGVYMSGTIVLKDNVTLNIRRGAVLRGVINPLYYFNIDTFVDATGQSRGECLVGSVDAKNIGIVGNGTIDGEGAYFRANQNRARMREAGATEEQIEKYATVRPFLLRFVRSEGVTLKGVNLRNPAAWTCHLFQCKSIKIDGISIVAHVNQNNDGIDLDSCTGAEITNCDIDTGDDAMCFKTTSPLPCQDVVVRNCRLKSDWGAIKFGTESMGDFRNIKVENCEVYDTQGGGIKVLSVDGSNINNVRINKIDMVDVDMPIFVRLGERLRTYRDAPKQSVGSIDNLYISNIKAVTRGRDESRVNPPSGVLITGTPNARIGNITLTNIDITLPGGGTEADSKIVVPEDETRYPEFSHFGVQPAYGLNARHVDSLTIKNVYIRLSGKDQRRVSNISDVNSVPYEFPTPMPLN